MEENTKRITILKGPMRRGPLTGQFEFVEGNGDRFQGDLVDGVPHGSGLKTRLGNQFMKGLFHRGEFVTGEIRWKINDYSFSGTFHEGQIWTGWGRKAIEGGTEEGHFREGVLDGKGTRTLGSKVSSGTFQGGVLGTGQGWLPFDKWRKRYNCDWTFDEGLEYEGSILNTYPHGEGKVTDKNGRVVAQGIFRGGTFWSGRGRLFRDGQYLRAVVQEGKLVEILRVEQPNCISVGCFEGDQLNGLGAMIFNDNSIAIGWFRKGQLERGKVVKDWKLMEGHFDRNMELEGQGKVTYLQAQVVDGILGGHVVEDLMDWANQCLDQVDLEMVMGRMSFGETQEFETGEFLAGRLNEKGESKLGGVYRVGEFKEGKLHGQGKRIFPDGLIEEGRFLEDVWIGIDPLRPNPWKVQPRTHPGKLGVFHGEWPTGKGRLTFNDWAFEEGEFEDGVLKTGLRVFLLQPLMTYQVKIREFQPTGDLITSNRLLTILWKVESATFVEIEAIFDHSGLLPFQYWVREATRLISTPPQLTLTSKGDVGVLEPSRDHNLRSGLVVSHLGLVSKGIFRVESDTLFLVSGKTRLLDTTLTVEDGGITGAKMDRQFPEQIFPRPSELGAVNKAVLRESRVRRGWFLGENLVSEGFELWIPEKGRQFLCLDIGKFEKGMLVDGLRLRPNWAEVGQFIRSPFVCLSPFSLRKALPDRQTESSTPQILVLQEGLGPIKARKEDSGGRRQSISRRGSLGQSKDLPTEFSLNCDGIVDDSTFDQSKVEPEVPDFGGHEAQDGTLGQGLRLGNDGTIWIGEFRDAASAYLSDSEG